LRRLGSLRLSAIAPTNGREIRNAESEKKNQTTMFSAWIRMPAEP
jgi:hypothetical protein